MTLHLYMLLEVGNNYVHAKLMSYNIYGNVYISMLHRVYKYFSKPFPHINTHNIIILHVDVSVWGAGWGGEGYMLLLYMCMRNTFS